MTHSLASFDPIGRAFGKCRTAAAFGLSALVVGPTFVLLLLVLLGITDITVLMRVKGPAMAIALAKSAVYGLVAGLPMAGMCGLLLVVMARRGWDAIGIALAIGAMASVLPAVTVITIGFARMGRRLTLEPEFLWQLPLGMMPFAATGALMCALFWRIAIRHRRRARLTALQDAAAIRAME